jgi:hypothetical protein
MGPLLSHGHVDHCRWMMTTRHDYNHSTNITG